MLKNKIKTVLLGRQRIYLPTWHFWNPTRFRRENWEQNIYRHMNPKCKKAESTCYIRKTEINEAARTRYERSLRYMFQGPMPLLSPIDLPQEIWHVHNIGTKLRYHGEIHTKSAIPIPVFSFFGLEFACAFLTGKTKGFITAPPVFGVVSFFRPSWPIYIL